MDIDEIGSNLTKKQRIWLSQQGGRLLKDVFVEKGKMGIYLSLSGNKKEREFKRIPNDNKLILKRKKLGNSHYRELVREIVVDKS